MDRAIFGLLRIWPGIYWSESVLAQTVGLSPGGRWVMSDTC